MVIVYKLPSYFLNNLLLACRLYFTLVSRIFLDVVQLNVRIFK